MGEKTAWIKEDEELESTVVRRPYLIPDFDEQKVSEWLSRFEKKVRV